MRCWINGLPETEIAVSDRGLAYGDGLFETVLVQKGRLHLFEEHLQRLAKGLRKLSFPESVINDLKEDIAQVSLPDEAVLKIMVTRGAGQRGYALPASQHPRRIIMLADLTDFSSQAQLGVALTRCRYQLPINPALAQIKHLNRLDQVMARQEWDDPSIAEGVVTDTEGYIVEGTMSNLFWVHNGCLYTPLIDRCGVKGVMRDHLIKLASQMGLLVEEGRYKPEVLNGADEVFICNSLIKIWPVTRIDQKTFSIGSMTQNLQQALHKDLSC